VERSVYLSGGEGSLLEEKSLSTYVDGAESLYLSGGEESHNRNGGEESVYLSGGECEWCRGVFLPDWWRRVCLH